MIHELPVPENLHGAQFASEIKAAGHDCAEPGGVSITGSVLNVATDATYDQVAALLAAHVPDPDFGRSITERQWRAKLLSELTWLEGEVATAPASGTTTNGNAVARLDAVIQHIKRLDRDLIRLVRYVMDNVMDAD